MKRSSYPTAVGALALLLIAGCASPRPGCQAAPGVMSGSTPSAKTADSRTALALTAALQDERRAQTFYQSVMNTHGNTRPFSNIIRAEERHESMIATLMERYAVPIPPPDLTGLPAVPTTLSQSAALAAQLERDNIALYDRLIPGVQERDIRATFEALRTASAEHHLPAFERWAGTQAPAPAAPGCSARSPQCDATCAQAKPCRALP